MKIDFSNCDKPTANQMRLIEEIEDEVECIFEGTTFQEASAFISSHIEELNRCRRCRKILHEKLYKPWYMPEDSWNPECIYDFADFT